MPQARSRHSLRSTSALVPMVNGMLQQPMDCPGKPGDDGEGWGGGGVRRGELGLCRYPVDAGLPAGRRFRKRCYSAVATGSSASMSAPMAAAKRSKKPSMIFCAELPINALPSFMI